MIPRKILVATDGSPAARGAESFAAGLANMMGECQVTVAMVVNPDATHLKGGALMGSSDAEGSPFYPSDRAFFEGSSLPTTQTTHESLAIPSPAIQEAETVVADAAKRITDAIHNDKATVKPVVIQAVSSALGLIDEAHADGTCSLIVMGSRGHGGFASLVMGSVSTQVLHGAHCPVLIVKQ